MALEISTAGILLKYKAESVATADPSTLKDYIALPNIKSIPDFNPTPSTLDVTDLSDTTWKRYIEGLKDVGGSLEFGANLTSAFKTAWEAVCTAYETAFASNLAIWFEVYVPNFGSFYFTGKPSALGLPSVEVDAVFEGNVYITPNKIYGWGASSGVTP